MMSRLPHVLIVDDVADNREIYAEYLRFRGFSVSEAATGTDAIKEVRRGDPDVVLLDMRLPDLDGVEVSRRIRALSASRPVIIGLSAGVPNKEVDVALASGCALFLTKPCLPETLESEIRRILDMPASV
jgi:CheY-like chemotaxis protein